jgi:CheY-like chemotaxis protein
MNSRVTKGPHKRILVVDDERLIADTLGMIVGCQGFEAQVAYSGEQAVEVARDFRPDVLVSDIRMPGMNGIDAAEIIAESVPKCGVILFSGHIANMGFVDERIERYGWTLLAKPIPPQDLVGAVKMVLAIKSKEPLTILNVDDADIPRYTITHILEHAGFRVKEAVNGADALRLAKTLPDLILLDIHLPDMSGFEICTQLRKWPETAKIPIVHLTNTCRDDASRQRALELGANDYLTQPVEPEPFIALLRKLAAPSTAAPN